MLQPGGARGFTSSMWSRPQPGQASTGMLAGSRVVGLVVPPDGNALQGSALSKFGAHIQAAGTKLLDICQDLVFTFMPQISHLSQLQGQSSCGRPPGHATVPAKLRISHCVPFTENRSLNETHSPSFTESPTVTASLITSHSLRLSQSLTSHPQPPERL